MKELPDPVSDETKQYVAMHKVELLTSLQRIETKQLVDISPSQITNTLDHLLNAVLFDGKTFSMEDRGASELLLVAGTHLRVKNQLFGSIVTNIGLAFDHTPIGSLIQVGEVRNIHKSQKPEDELLYKALGLRGFQRDDLARKVRSSPVGYTEEDEYVLADQRIISFSDWILNTPARYTRK